MKHDVTDFQTEVIEQSTEIPVLVDFWAEWCGPCRILGPVLERMAESADGQWELKKLDTEAFPEIARDYRIYSIPAVKLFVDGEVVDEFVGALPEPQIRQWLKNALPDKNESTLTHAEALLTALEFGKAASLLEPVAAKVPDHEHARTLLACALLFTDPKRAMSLVQRIETGADAERADAVRTLARFTDESFSLASLPDSPEKGIYSAAVETLRTRDFDGALGHFIEVLRLNRLYDDDGSRKACIAIFKLLGEEHPITLRHRQDFNRAF